MTIRLEPSSAGAMQPTREFGGFPHQVLHGNDSELSDRTLVQPGETFASLDAARSSPPAAWIHAGTRHAEAGFLDPALGWVGVRADAVGDRVHASVVPVSAQAAQVLGSHLESLNAYLSEQHGASATVTMGSFENGQGGQGGPGTSGNLHDDVGAETRRETSSQNPEPAPVQEAASIRSLTAMPVGASAAGGTARYISVMA